MRPLSAALFILAPALSGATVLESWTFGPPLSRTLHEISPAGPGIGGPTQTWDVAIPGVSTTSLGLRLRNTGIGGFGTRTAFADLDTPVSGGNLELQLEIAAWNWSQEAEDSPRLRLEMIRGNDFVVAGIDLQRMNESIRVRPLLDDRGTGITGDGSEHLPLASAAVVLGISVDLDAGTYRFGFREADATEFTLVDSGSIDEAGGPVHSLRFAMEGDFTLGALQAAYMDLSAITVTSGAMNFAQETTGFAAWADGFGLEGENASPTAILFGDGTPLLLKYALGIDPTVPVDSTLLPQATVSEDAFAFSFTRTEASDILYIVETSLDLVSWTPLWTSADGDPFDPAPTLLISGPEAGSAKFIRLRIELID